MDERGVLRSCLFGDTSGIPLANIRTGFLILCKDKEEHDVSRP
jgi:hypothetical protein